VPSIIRHSLNLESGLNDGLALPAVLVLAAALDPTSHHFVWWRFVLRDLGLGLAFGVVCGLIGSVVMPRAGQRPAGKSIPSHQRALYGLGIALGT
jgi:NhaP-type Na+/H+ or K+/H+ antiporter